MINNTENTISNDFISDFTVIDIETTGLSSERHEIIELSAIRVRDCKITDKFSTLVKPNGHINSFIRGLTGISDEMVCNAPEIKTVLPEFIEFLSNDILLGHNINFDLRFIRHNLKKHFDKDLHNEHLDTMRLSRKYMQNLTSHKLQTLAGFFNVSTVGHHRALNDCIMTFEIYQNIKKCAKS